MDADLAVYLDKVKERRSELGESMVALQAVLDEPPAIRSTGCSKHEPLPLRCGPTSPNTSR